MSQVREPVSLSDPNSPTLTGNQAALLGIRSPEPVKMDVICPDGLPPKGVAISQKTDSA